MARTNSHDDVREKQSEGEGGGVLVVVKQGVGSGRLWNRSRTDAYSPDDRSKRSGMKGVRGAAGRTRSRNMCHEAGQRGCSSWLAPARSHKGRVINPHCGRRVRLASGSDRLLRRPSHRRREGGREESHDATMPRGLWLWRRRTRDHCQDTTTGAVLPLSSFLFLLRFLPLPLFYTLVQMRAKRRRPGASSSASLMKYVYGKAILDTTL